jgi:hypothetical protein
MSRFDSEAAVQQAVSKLFQKILSIYFALRNPLILINRYILLRIIYVVERTEHRSGICLKWKTRNFYSVEICTVTKSVNYFCIATLDSYKTRVGL